MKLLFVLRDQYIWLANAERKIFMTGNGVYLSADGEKCPDSEISRDNDFAQRNEEVEDTMLVDPAHGRLVSFTDREVQWEIGDGFGNFGFKDTHGKVLIEPQYAWVGEFRHGLCPVNLGCTWYRTPEGERYYENHYGYIDERGKTIIPFRFQEAHNFNKYGVAVVEDDTDSYMIDTHGNEIEGTRFPYLEECVDYDERYIQFSLADQWYDNDRNHVGLYDTKERRVFCEPKYSDFYQYDEDTILVTLDVEDRPGDIRQWFINSQGEHKYPWQLEKSFAMVNPPDEAGNFIVATTSYKEAVETEENDIYCFYKGDKTFERRFWFGVMDYTGKMILPTIYEGLWYLGCGFYACKKDGVIEVYEAP